LHNKKNNFKAIEDLEWEEAEGDEIEITDNEKVKELLDQYKNNK
jgi:hypothetical protein